MEPKYIEIATKMLGEPPSEGLREALSKVNALIQKCPLGTDGPLCIGLYSRQVIALVIAGWTHDTPVG